MTINAQQMGATDLLAAVLFHLSEKYPDAEGVGVGNITDLPTGVMAGVLLPTGDRYRLIIQWVGDNENDSDVPVVYPQDVS